MTNRSRRDRSPRPSADPQTTLRYDRWDWWRKTADSASAAQKEFGKLPPEAQGELIDRMQRFREGTTRFRDVDDLGGGIKELRVRLRNNHYRVLFCTVGRAPVALTAFYKNQQRTEKTDLDRAKARKRSHYAG